MTTRTMRLRRIFATILRYEVLPRGAVEVTGGLGLAKDALAGDTMWRAAKA